MAFPLKFLGACLEIIIVISQKMQTNKYKEKTVDRDHGYKSKETRVVTYTCNILLGIKSL